MKKKIILILIVIFIILILLTFSFWSIVENEKKYYIQYTISIETNSSFTIYSPIVFTDEHSSNEIISHFKVSSGDIKISKIEISSDNDKYSNLTNYPINDEAFPEGNRECYRYNNVGLKIEGSGNGKVNFKISGDTYYSGLTFADYYNYGHLIFASKDIDNRQLTIIIEMHVKAYNRFTDYDLEKNTFNLKNGWNNVNITSEGGIF